VRSLCAVRSELELFKLWVVRRRMRGELR